ncbi:MAG: tRNA (guanosine(37)-N1)-methyltransferase TrmD [Dehalococcoidia bacterium]|nr:tRNA (guanosine(37)-N1)-methyltransferase TrmD [Dehalococcoidia bacterium]
MHIDIFCLFPEMLDSPLEQSIIKRAREKGLVEITAHNIRDYTHDKHHTVDDYSYGGGPGMVLKPEPIFEAVDTIKQRIPAVEVPIVLLTPAGRLFNQRIALEMASSSHLMLICGHYEGIDERVREHLATDEISLGDYILSGGETAAIVLIDAVVRLIPGVLGSEMSLNTDSHTNNLLEYPQYTRPPVYRDWEVPPILFSGNHREIDEWRRRKAILRTCERRPDLLERANLSPEEKQWIFESLSSPK